MVTQSGQRILECCRIIIKRGVVVKMQDAQETMRSRVIASQTLKGESVLWICAILRGPNF